jgi:tetratricopeptide (TPR) repeat protein
MTTRRARLWVLVAAAIWLALPAAAQAPAPNARQLIHEGGRALAQGEPDQAQKAYEAALGLAASDDDRALALFGLANVHRSRRDAARQLECLRRVEALPQAGAAYVQSARRQMAAVYREQRDYAAARQMTEKLLAEARTPEERLPLTLSLAQLDLQEGQPAAAVRRLQPLISGQPQTRAQAEVYPTLLTALIRADRVPEAVALARETLKQFPDRTDILLNTAQELCDHEKLDEALALLQEALLARPEQEEVLRALYDLCRQRDQLARLTDWLAKQARGDATAAWLGRLAQVYEWASRPAEALTVYERLLALQPREVALLARAAQLALQANDFARAETWLRQALAVQPGDEPTVTLLGEALLRQGKLQPALATWREGLGFAADDAQAVRKLGLVLMRYELYEAALDVYREGRQASGQPGAYALNMAGAYEKLGQLPEAAREYATALLAPDRSRTGGVAASELYRLADDPVGGPAVVTALQAARQTEGFPTEGLGALLYAQARQGDDTRPLLAEMLSAGPGGPDRREATSAALRAASRLEMRGQPELALPLYEHLRRTQPDAELDVAVARRMADLQIKAGDWRGAQTTLQQLLRADGPGALPDARRAEVALKLGDILLRQARRPTDAVGAYEIAVKSSPDTLAARLAQWGQADALFALGETTQALEEYGRLLKLPAPQGGAYSVPGLPGSPGLGRLPQDDYVAFQAGEALLRQGQYAKAGEAFHKLAAADAASPYANDALQRVLLIGRLQQDKLGAEAYLRALQAWAQGEAEVALQALAPLTDGAAGPLRDVALMMLAEIRVWQSDTAAAVAAYDRLPAECPDSPLNPQAAFTAAMLLGASDRPAARTRLQALTQKFPDATEAEEAQLVLRAWEGK